MEDTVIINLYFDRSEKAIQATEEKYSKYCFSIAWNVLYDKEDSDECVNDTWLAAWNSIPPRKPARGCIEDASVSRVCGCNIISK